MSVRALRHLRSGTPRHRGARPDRPGRRRTSLLAALALGTGLAGVLTASPASAAGPWFVAPGGNNAASCLSAAAPCATVTGALAKAGVAAGDTINVEPGTYVDRPAITKPVKVVGTAPGVVFQGAAGAWALAVNTTGAVELRNLTLTGGGYAAGGALPIVGGSVKAYDVAITDSTAIAGGGVYLYSGSLEMYGGRISGNKATAIASNALGWGGAAYLPAGTSLLLDGVTVENNTANGAGVAAYALGGAITSAGNLTLRDSTVRGNTVLSSGASANTGYGGAIYANGPSTVIDGGIISGNTATYGGAVVAAQPVTVTGAEVSGNTAAVGGAFYTTAALSLTGGEVSGNTASVNYGGGVYAVAPLVVDGTEISGNTAPLGGGGVLAAAVTLRNGAEVSGNSSQSGAGVWATGTLDVQDSTIAGNDASFQAGGVLIGSTNPADSPVATIVDSEITGNTAALAGGGIVSLAKARIDLTRSRISDNTALGGGGVAVGADSTARFDRLTATGNVATSLGGGAIVSSGRSTIVDSTLSGNEAVWTSGSTTGLGGAIYSGSSNSNVATELTIRRSTLSGNRAYGGAAVLSYSTGSGATSKTTIDSSTISGNRSSSTSGAILNGAHRLTITASTIADNTAAAGGSGGIASFTSVDVGVAGTVLAGNTPKACNLPVTSGGDNLAAAADTGCGVATGTTDLGPLADNGGPGRTHLPGPGSALLDAIAPGAATGLTDAVTGAPVVLCAAGAKDQRGTARPQGARCDIGAVEAAQEAPTLDVPATLDLNVGSPVDQVLATATGSPRPAITATGLPAGLSLVDNGDGTAQLSGTPAAPGGSRSVIVTAANEAGSVERTVTIEVREAPALSGPTSLTYRVGTAAGPDEFRQTGGHPPATLGLDGELPEGLGFTPGTDGSDGTGVLAGTPAAGTGGVHQLTVTGSNGTGPDATWPFTLTVEEAPSVSADDATARVGVAIALPITTGGYPAPTVTATGLPGGLTLSGGEISGTPDAGTGGVHEVTLTADNGIGEPATTVLTVVVKEAPEIDGPSAVRFVVGTHTSVAFAATGYPTPELSVTGALPAGLSFSDNGEGGGVLSGTPAASAEGSHPVTVTASDGTRTATLDVVIEVAPRVEITTTTLPAAAVGSAYESFVVAEGGSAPYAFTVASGSLPAGLTLGTDGRISGTPTGTPGTADVEIQVTDSGDPRSTSRRTLAITVAKGVTTLVAEPVITTNALLATGTLRARLTGGLPSHPLSGQTVTFKGAAGLPLCTAVTNASGIASCNLTLLGTVLTAVKLGYTAEYAGSAKWLPASATGALLQVSVNAVLR